jgi:hypothetical protein
MQAMELIMLQGNKKVEAALTSSQAFVYEVLVRISARTPEILTEILGGISQPLQANYGPRVA